MENGSNMKWEKHESEKVIKDRYEKKKTPLLKLHSLK